jgi:hypothetical protein
VTYNIKTFDRGNNIRSEEEGGGDTSMKCRKQEGSLSYANMCVHYLFIIRKCFQLLALRDAIVYFDNKQRNKKAHAIAFLIVQTLTIK